jgi:hypothetical protein
MQAAQAIDQTKYSKVDKYGVFEITLKEYECALSTKYKANKILYGRIMLAVIVFYGAKPNESRRSSRDIFVLFYFETDLLNFCFFEEYHKVIMGLKINFCFSFG